MKKVFKVSLIAVLFLAGCGIASTLSSIANWAPVADAAFNSIVSIVVPGAQSAVLKTDAGDVVAALKDVAVDAVAAEQANAGASAKQKVANDLGAIAADLPKVTTDLDAIIPASDQKFVNDAVLVIQTVDVAYEAAIGLTPVVAQVNLDCGGYQTYADSSIHIWANCGRGDSIDYASGGAAAAASPQASQAPPNLGDFKRQFNAVCQRDGHPEKQLKLTLAEHLHLR
jgi:hypothetical protein